MAVIGSFTKTDKGWAGKLQTLMIRGTEIRIEKADSLPNERSPDYRVFFGTVEVGAGWTKEGQSGGTYVSLQIDDPLFPAPLFANLVFSRERDEAALLWNRPKPKRD